MSDLVRLSLATCIIGWLAVHLPTGGHFTFFYNNFSILADQYQHRLTGGGWSHPKENVEDTSRLP